jgi:hypothetical protein
MAFNIILIRAAQNRAREARAEEAQRNGVSTMQYADNNALQSKGITVISSETESMTSSNSELATYATTRLPEEHSPV